VPEGVAVFTCNLILDPGETLRVSVVDPDGQPLTGFGVRGQRAETDLAETRIENSTFDVLNLSADNPRAVYVHHAGKNFGKAFVIALDPNGPREMTIRLEPCATATGRVRDRNGERLADDLTFNVSVVTAWRERRISGLPVQTALHPASRTESPGFAGRHPPVLPVDAEGWFRFTGLLPGCDYFITCHQALPGASGGISRQAMETISRTISIKPGETIDLGELRLRQQ
jgi:hypothetical protein